MKKDAFEKFVTSHRQAMDHRTPPDKIWIRISAALFRDQSTSLWHSAPLWRAAAILLMGVSIYLFVKGSPETEKRTASTQQEFKDIELYYTGQISEKVAMITNEGLFADESFTQDLQKLEAMYTVMAEEMKNHPSDKVKDALVLNMLVRIDLLNQQIQKLEDSKQKPTSSSI
jgi:hypothetical protein